LLSKESKMKNKDLIGKEVKFNNTTLKIVPMGKFPYLCLIDSKTDKYFSGLWKVKNMNAFLFDDYKKKYLLTTGMNELNIIERKKYYPIDKSQN
ncbi:MAG: hypothetical protein U9R42_08860, partial [Bacteroidota bacterium]|nr:hypothetical protein [Bacteroidota bacterium]